MTAILVIDDDPHVRRYLRTALTGHGHLVAEATSVASGLAELARRPPGVVLLDLGLPDGDGLAVLRALRPDSTVPVIVLSARGQEGDKVAALDAGADDYLTKPFGTGELLARIRVALRHAGAAGTGELRDVLEAGPIRVDQPRHEVTVGGAVVHLTPIEFKILVELVRQPGRVVTHRRLVKAVWGATPTDQSHTLRVHVAALRRKIEADPARPHWLLTEAGVGYRLRDGD
ncbi:MAG: response regulator [Deltaproteobacteria bacterium]|nr:response regulator [Deltaproteobacteria bacterium]MCW5804767.1 response regulator [Deltaproteobacteria bacterium]